MKKFLETTLRYAVLTALTIVSCMAMWWVSRRDIAVASAGQAGTAPPPVAASPKSLVTVKDIRPEIAETLIKATGKIRPWETYSLGFEIGGRVQSLGEDAQGKPLDEGARVTAGQVLAQLDDRILRARSSETIAQLEQAVSDLRRARNLRDLGGQAITDAEYQEFLTQSALAKAQQEMAVKNLEDSVLVSPVSGTISKRMVEPGESVAPNEIVFEVVENDQVLLVVDVPEAQVRELELRKRAVEESASSGRGDAESRVFRARVQLEGRDRFGNPWPAIEAEVYRIAQVADQRTGLFEVEIRIPNDGGLLRPGMVATASIVTDRLLAYRIPENAVLFRGGEAFLFSIRSERTPVEAMFWEVGETEILRAQRVELDQRVDQGDELLVPATAVKLGPVVVRGQQRLFDGQLVRLPNEDAPRTMLSSDSPLDAEMTARRLPETRPSGAEAADVN